MILMSFSVLFYQFSSTLSDHSLSLHTHSSSQPRAMSTAQGTESMDKSEENKIFYGSCYHVSLCNTVCLQAENVAFLIQSQPTKNLCLKRENNSKGWSSYRAWLPHYPGHCKDSISLAEFRGSICIYNCRVKNWCPSTYLLCDLGCCSSTAGKFICLYFERLVKYYTVPARSEQTPFTVSVNPVSLQNRDSSVCSPATLLGWAETFKKAVHRQTVIQAQISKGTVTLEFAFPLRAGWHNLLLSLLVLFLSTVNFWGLNISPSVKSKSRNNQYGHKQ